MGYTETMNPTGTPTTLTDSITHAAYVVARLTASPRVDPAVLAHWKYTLAVLEADALWQAAAADALAAMTPWNPEDAPF